MKSNPLAIRGSAKSAHQPIKRGTKIRRRNSSVNGRTSAQKPVTGSEVATLLRKFQKMLTPEEHSQIAAGIDEARRRMAHEHLH